MSLTPDARCQRAALLSVALFLAGCEGCFLAPADPFVDAGALVDGGALIPCEGHQDCPLGTRCDEAGCVTATREPAVAGCFGDADCDEGYACAVSTGRCVALPPPSASPAPVAECSDGQTRRCGSKIGSCAYGTEPCVAGAWSGSCQGGIAPAAESCDGLDNDCNGVVDDAAPTPCLLGAPPCQVEGELSCSPDGSGTLCVAPASADESCNGVDDNTDGCIDEGFDLGSPCAAGLGACRRVGARVCSADGSGTVCDAVAGSAVPELCNDIDDDCDGTIDEGCDDDGDDYCDAALGFAGASAACPLSVSAATLDCNDDNAAIHPGAAEICDNAVDEDCDGELSEGCDAPVAVCAPAALSAAPFGTVTLDGAGSYDGAGGALSYAWSVTSSPAGSTAAPAQPGSATSSFTPDLAGSYEVTLTVTNPQGVSGTCVITVDVVPPASLHVQLVWQEAVGDLDLHLSKHDVAPLGAFFDVTGKDTWWARPTNDWGTVGAAAGDASLDVDDRAGFGPENTNIDLSPGNGSYHVGVHLYCEQDQTSQNQFSGPEGPRNAKVRIYCGGQLVDEIPVGWRTLAKAGDFWIPARIDWSGAGCSVTRLDSLESGVRYCRALGGCGATATYGLPNDCRAERRCDNNAGCRSYELCLGNGNNKKCYLKSCTQASDCPAGHRCAPEYGNVCAR